MPSQGLPSFLAVAALLTAGLAAPASGFAGPRAGEDRTFASSTTLEVQGTLTVAEIETLGTTPSHTTAYAVTTDDGYVVPIALTEDHPANSSFSGELVVDGELAQTLDSEGLLPPAGRTIDADSAAGQAAAAAAQEQVTPLPVAEATVIAPGETSQTVTPSAHRAYVVKMVDQAPIKASNTKITADVDAMLGYWVTESGGAITSFARQGEILDYDSAGDVPPEQGCGITNPFAVWNDALNLFPRVDFNAAGNHLIVLVSEECGEFGPVGVATIGTGLSSGGPSILTYDPQTFAATGAHELGHNFGLQHANLDHCPDEDTCEYHNFYSPMGLSIGAPPVFTPTALGTLYRAELDLVAPGEVATVASPQAALTQSFALAPRSSTAGLRGLLVTDPSTGTTYSVDWRSHTGRDATSFYGNTLGYGFSAPTPTYPAGVVIERQSGREATYLMTQMVDGRQTGAFAPGHVFAPSPRLRIAVNAIDGSTATVTVQMGAAPTPPAPPAAPKKLSAKAPKITGTARVGKTLKVKVGAWSPRPAYRYQWYAGGKKITKKGTKSSFKLTSKQKGKRITVRVTGTKSGYVTVTKASKSTKKVAKKK